MVLRPEKAGFVLAGLGGPGDVLDHYLNGLEWRLPRTIELRPEVLWWDAHPAPESIGSGPRLLEDFIKLADGSDEAILRYAKKWGPLWLCDHGLHWRHDLLKCRPRDYSHDDPWWGWRSEPLSVWRQLAREARATLRIARKLTDCQLGDLDDWRAIPGQGERIMSIYLRWEELQWISEDADTWHQARLQAGDDLERLEVLAEKLDQDERSRGDYLDSEEAWRWERVAGGATLEIQERLLAIVLDGWLDRAGVKPSMHWQAGKRSVRLGGYGLYGAIAVQLLFDACRTDGLAICTSCGTPYLPASRRPRRDQNSYCPDCGLKAALRDAAARYRQTDKYRQARQRRLERQRRGSAGGRAPDSQ